MLSAGLYGPLLVANPLEKQFRDRWTGQQIIEAFPWDTAPKYLLRDRDAIYGNQFQKRVKSMGIEKVLTAPRSPWQNAFVERVIGSIRRDCLDHVVVLN
jgi:transposase InsO family protein